MDLQLGGSVAVVTGASKGIGLAVVRALRAEGALVVAGARSPGVLEGLEGVTAVAVDLARPGGPEQLVADALRRHGRVDVLVNNVGGAPVRPGGFLSIGDAEFEASLQLNFLSALRATRAAVEAMLDAGGGAIVNVASVAGLVGLKNRVAYSASKGAVIALTRALAVDHVGDGIRVNAVCPGTIDTPWVQRLVTDAGESLDALRARQPMGRLGTPEEVADAVLYLATAEFATGTILTVDGGLTAA